MVPHVTPAAFENQENSISGKIYHNMGGNLVNRDRTQCQYFWEVYERESKANSLTVSWHNVIIANHVGKRMDPRLHGNEPQ